ncbi:MAG TPA: iron-containing redox enzyme family protein [Rhodanobacteraceae bacterium]|nr:iron-containing redox enzyme family protein [Rhodanobacteraceae bacterium]
MSIRFELSGPLTELSSYPQWTQDMVAECDPVKKSFVGHELWDLIRDGKASHDCMVKFMVGIWPVIEGFPGFMARSLLKTRYGRSEGDNLARRWLVRNIRVEQNHAEYWLNWSEGHNVSRRQLIDGVLPPGTRILADWCEEISTRGALAPSIAAVNYAIEGATGEWSQILYASEGYAARFPESTRRGTMRWLQLHAAYDDTHPWEALEIVCTILGATPKAADVMHIAECVKRSYVAMRILADRCVAQGPMMEAGYESAVAA